MCVYLLAVRLRYACPTWTLYLALTSTCLTKASYPALHTYTEKVVLNMKCTQWHCKKTQKLNHSPVDELKQLLLLLVKSRGSC